MDRNEIMTLVVYCLHEIFLKDTEVGEQCDLLEYGLDSMCFFRLIIKLEDEFNMTIPDAEISLDNFTSVSNIADTIDKLIHRGK